MPWKRLIAHVDDFDPLDVGDPIMLRIDPKEPQFSVTALDVAPSFEDWIPVELLIAIVLTFIGSRSDGDSPRQSGSATENE